MKARTLLRIGLASLGALLLAADRGKEPLAGAIDWEFIDQAKTGKVPVSVLIPRLRAMVGPDASPDDALFFDDLFAVACARADRAEWEECAKLAAELPEDSFRFSACFSALSDASLRDWVGRLSAEKPTPPVFPKTTLAPPAQLAKAPVEILEAWTLYQSVTAPFRELQRTERTEQPPPGGDIVFAERALRQLVKSPEPGLWRQLLKCDWRGFCGTGSDMLYHPRNRGILLSLLADGKLAEAAGAALSLRPDSMGRGEPISPTLAKLLTSLGLDWEALYLGSLLPDSGESFGLVMPANRVSLFDWSEHKSWSALAAIGSDRGIRFGLALIHFVDPERDETMQFLETALGPEPEDGRVVFSSGGAPLKRTQPVSPAVRRELLTTLASLLAPSQPAAALDETLEDLPTRLVPELRASLNVLAANPSRRVASKARDLLRESGTKETFAALPPAPPPLQRRLLANGQPLSGVELTLSSEPQQRGLDYKLRTGDDGLLRIPLENLPDIRALREITLRSEPKRSFGWDPFGESREASAPPCDATEATPWFTLTTPVASGETGVRDVPITLAALEVRLVPAGKEPAGRRAAVNLSHYKQAGDEYPEYQTATLELEVGGSARFTRLQTGTYRVVVRAEGFAYFESEKITLGSGGGVVPVALQRGVEATGALIFPNGKRQTLDWTAELHHDGKLLHRSAYLGTSPDHSGWRGLAPGKYRAVVEAAQNVAPEDRHGRLEFTFEIKEDSASPIVLGEHHVPPAD